MLPDLASFSLAGFGLMILLTLRIFPFSQHQVPMMIVPNSGYDSGATVGAPPIPPPIPLMPEWSTALQTVLDQPTSTLPRYLTFGGVLFVTSVMTWAWVGQIDEVAQATGKLIPQGEVFQVAPIESGKIERLAVKEGQAVRKGEVLAELDTDLTEKEIQRLQAVIAAIQTERLETLAMVDKTRLQAQTRLDVAASEMQAQQVVIRQNLATIETSRLMVNQLRDDAAQEGSRLARLKPLSDVGAIPRERVFEIESTMRSKQRSITESGGSLQRVLGDTDRLKVELQQKRSQMEQAKIVSQQELQQLQSRLTGLQSRQRETQILLAAAQTRLKQRYLLAPVDGTILTLNPRNQGEVVSAGQSIAEIAPQGKPLILSAMLPSQEAGFVKVGMTVRLKMDAYPYQDYGVIEGRVLNVSADSKSNAAPGVPSGVFYRVDIALARQNVHARGQVIHFRPGQTATAEIVTRRRQILETILEPIQKLRNDRVTL
jgi:hemolysin D